jgi:hypothetical protein
MANCGFEALSVKVKNLDAKSRHSKDFDAKSKSPSAP